MKKVEEKDLLRLLGREPIMPEMSAALGALRGRRILVTGAGGVSGRSFRVSWRQLRGLSFVWLIRRRPRCMSFRFRFLRGVL